MWGDNGSNAPLPASRYWDDLVSGADVQGDEPMHATTIQWIDRFRTQPAPVGMREEIWRQLHVEAKSGIDAVVTVPQPSPIRKPLPMSTSQGWPNRWIAIAAGLLLLLGIGGASAWYWAGGEDELQTVPAAMPAAQASPAVAQATPSGFVPTLPADAPVTFLWSLDSAGDTQLQWPQDVAIAPDGNLWVYDFSLHSVAIFSPDGEFIELWGGEGSGEGQFQNLVGENDDGGSAFDADGNYYVADTGNYRVQKFDSNHQFLLAWGEQGEGDGQFEGPNDVAIDSVGNVFVLDAFKSEVQVFDSEGTFLSSFPVITASGSPVRGPTRFAIDGEDRVWIIDFWQGRLFSYGKDGELLASIFKTNSDLSLNPAAIAFDKFGRILVASLLNRHIQLLDSSGNELAQWGQDEGVAVVFPGAVTGVTVDEEGNVYVILALPGGDGHNLYKFKLKPEFWPEE